MKLKWLFVLLFVMVLVMSVFVVEVMLDEFVKIVMEEVLIIVCNDKDI